MSKVYGFCDAGCRYRVPTYDEFEKSASIIPVVADERGMFRMEIGKTYIIGRSNCNIPIYWETANMGNFFEIVCDTSKYRKSAKVALFDVYDELDSGVYRRNVAVEINGEIKTIEDPIDTTSRSSAYTYLKDNCYMYLYTEESERGTIHNRVNAVYLVNEDATITAEDGKSAYEVALANGFEGTEAEWLASLKGDKGDLPVVTVQDETLTIDGATVIENNLII